MQGSATCCWCRSCRGPSAARALPADTVKDKRNWRRCRAASAPCAPKFRRVTCPSGHLHVDRSTTASLDQISEEPELELGATDALLQQMAVNAAQFLGIFDRMANVHQALQAELHHRRRHRPQETPRLTSTSSDVLLSARNLRYLQANESCSVPTSLAPPQDQGAQGRGNGTAPTDMLLKIKKTLDSQSGGLFGFVYDMALHSADIDRKPQRRHHRHQQSPTHLHRPIRRPQHRQMQIQACRRHIGTAMPVIAIDVSTNHRHSRSKQAPPTTPNSTASRRYAKNAPTHIVIWGHWAVPSIQGVPRNSEDVRGERAVDV